MFQESCIAAVKMLVCVHRIFLSVFKFPLQRDVHNRNWLHLWDNQAHVLNNQVFPYKSAERHSIQK